MSDNNNFKDHGHGLESDAGARDYILQVTVGCNISDVFYGQHPLQYEEGYFPD